MGNVSIKVMTAIQSRWHEVMEHDSERGEGLVSFLIVVAAVAVVALVAMGVFDGLVRDKVDDIDLGS